MRRKMLALLLSFSVLLFVFSLTGCNDKKSKVYFLNFKPELADVYKEIISAYKEEKGIDIKLVTVASNSYEKTLKSEIGKLQAPTIFQIDGAERYENWKNYCLDIRGSKLYSYLSDNSLAIKEGDGVYAVPCDIEGYGIIYNAEIMRRYFELPQKSTDITSAEQIDSFDKLKSVIEDITDNKSKLGIQGAFASTSLSEGEAFRWHTQLLNIPLYYELSENSDYDNPTIAGFNTKNIEFKYHKNFRNIFDLYLNNSITDKKLLGTKTAADSIREFAEGKVAMMQGSSKDWSKISDVNTNAIKEENIKFLPIYTDFEGEKGQGICIGSDNYFAINKNTSEEQQKASLDFLDWLFSSDKGKDFIINKLKFTAPFNTLEENELNDNPLEREVLRYAKNDSLKTIPFIYTSFPSEEFKNSVGGFLLDYAQGIKEWDELKTDLVKKWKSER